MSLTYFDSRKPCRVVLCSPHLPPPLNGLGWVRVGVCHSPHPLSDKAGFSSVRPSWTEAGWASICCLRLWAIPLASSGVARYGQARCKPVTTCWPLSFLNRSALSSWCAAGCFKGHRLLVAEAILALQLLQILFGDESFATGPSVAQGRCML